MEPEARPSQRGSFAEVGSILLGMLGLLAGGLGAWIAVVRDPDGGQPFAVSRIDQTKPPVGGDATATQSQVRTAVPGQTVPEQAMPQPSDRSTASELEEQSGVKVVRSGGGEVPGSIVIKVPSPAEALKLAPAPDRRLVEKSRHGALPKLGADGSRPAISTPDRCRPRRRRASAASRS
jgi:hypothetical protein